MPGFNYGGGAGDGTNWSSERGSDPTTPGGGDNGHSGDRDTGGNSGTSPDRSGNWADTGPVNTTLINNAILEAIKNGLPRGTIAATSTPAYKAMRAAFDALAIDKQPAARDQINKAWQRAHDDMPDTQTSTRERGGRNGQTWTVTIANGHKKTQAAAILQVNSDIQGALSQHQATVAAAQKAAADARTSAENEARQRAAGLSQAEIDAQKRSGALQEAINSAQGKASTLNNALSSANNVVLQKQKELEALGKQLLKAQESVKQTLIYANDPLNSRKFFNAKGYLVDTERAIANKKNEINSAVASRDKLNTQLSQANADLQQFKNEKASADAALHKAQVERLEAEKKKKEAIAAAAEQKRLSDMAAAAAKKAAEDARLAAEKEKTRQARQAAADKLQSPDVQSVRGISASAITMAVPLRWSAVSGGSVALGSDIASALSSYISSALAELRAVAAASLAGPVAVTIAGLLYSKEVGAGSDIVLGRDISALMPADSFSLPDTAALNHAADTNGSVPMSVRGRLVLREDGTLETQLVRTQVAGSVPVVRALLDKDTGYWGYKLPAMADIPGQTILVSPSDAPGANGPLTLSGPVPLPERILHTGDQISAPKNLSATITPIADELDFNDIILVFPSEAALKPLYIMLRSPRNMPGTVDGKGQQAGDNWLADVDKDDGVPIPSQISDKLRGKTYSSFDAFRNAFWRAVAANPEMSQQFEQNDLNTMKKGRAPFVRKSERVGKRVKVELHHKHEISKGGDVYNVDNLSAVTPKRHIEIHKGN